MPTGLPASPEVRANTRSYVATCIPVLKRFIPLMTQSSPSRLAVVSSHVASEPWSGSVRPNAIASSWRMTGSMSSFCSGVPSFARISAIGWLPTTLVSVCRSECSPIGLLAMCSRMSAMSWLVPSLPPISFGSA
jgi:hypothetical protein